MHLNFYFFWFINYFSGSDAIKGTGIDTGMEWLINQMKIFNKLKRSKTQIGLNSGKLKSAAKAANWNEKKEDSIIQSSMR